MQPNYTARKSIVPVLSFWLILFFWLVIPLIVQIVRILAAKAYVIEFYDERIVVKSGILNKKERQSVFSGVFMVSVEQSLFGQMFGYGRVVVDCPGKWDIDTDGIKDPRGLKNYLEGYIRPRDNTVTIMSN